MDATGMKQLHEKLTQVFDTLVTLPEGGWPEGISSDAVFALGQASGIVSKAKALVGRDIDAMGGEPASPESTLTRSGFR